MFTPKRRMSIRKNCAIVPIPSSGSQSSEGLFIGWCRNWNRELQDSTQKLILFETDCGKVRASLVAQMVKKYACNAENGFCPWVENIRCRKNWQHTPIFFPGEFCGERSLVDYSPWCFKELHTAEKLYFHFISHGKVKPNSSLKLWKILLKSS